MRNLLTLLLVLTITCSFSQVGIPSGSALLGGCVSYKSKTTEVTQPNFDDIKSTSYNIEAHGLFGLNQNWYVGGLLGYEGEKETQTNQEQKSSLFSIGPAVRYQYSFIERAACFMMFDLTYGAGKIEDTQTITNPVTNLPEDVTTTDKYSRISAMVSPGITFRIKPQWTFDIRFGSLGYTSTTYKPDDDIPNAEDYSENKFKLHMNTDHLRFGMQYVLGGGF
jgi:hypothetical protein